jgi:hypothetical protein
MSRDDEVLHLESHLYKWACGEVSTAKLKRAFKALGWSADLRTMRNNWIDAEAPNGDFVTLYC